MQHLTPEVLARLVDEPPDRTEAAHLAACPACQQELDAFRRQTAALAGMAQVPVPEAPAEQWAGVLAGLQASAPVGVDEGMDDLAIRRPTRLRRIPWFRIAAAVAIYVGGTATGLAMTHRTPETAAVARPTPLATTSPATQPLASAARPAANGEQVGAAPSPAVEPEPEARAGGGGSARLASAPDAAPSGRLRPLPDASDAASPAEALQAMRAAERAYVRAYSRYTELANPQQTDDPTVRIAALESIAVITRQALDRAPTDPLINGYHLTAVAQRDAALRQVALKSNAPWF